MRAEPAKVWSAVQLAERLYIGEARALDLMRELCRSGMAQQQAHSYCYAPSTPQLGATIDALADLYGRQLVDITNLVHSKRDRKAQQFADAFRWRKE